MRISKFTRILAVVLGIVAVVALCACSTTDKNNNLTVDPNAVIGYVQLGDSEAELTLADLNPAYLEAGRFPDSTVRRKLMDERFEFLKEQHEGFLTTEDEVMYFRASRAEAYAYELVDRPYTIDEIYYVDLHPAYLQACTYRGSEGIYLRDLMTVAAEQKLEAPNWLSLGEYDVLCAVPNRFEDMFSSETTAVTAWLSDGIPEAEVHAENGASVRLYGRFVKEVEDNTYLFATCWGTTPCTTRVSYDKEHDSFVTETAYCEECLSHTRTRYGAWTANLKQTHEECFQPLYGEAIGTLNVPSGEWDNWDELTCVFAGQVLFWDGSQMSEIDVDVYNARRATTDDATEMGCLIIRKAGYPLWIKGAILCSVENGTLRLWDANTNTPAPDMSCDPTANGGWFIS